MKIRRLAATTLGAGMALALAACGGGGGGGEASAGEEPYIAIVSKGFQHQFWQAVQQGAQQQAKKQGARITFVGPPTEQDIEVQIDQLTNALAKSPDALGFAALDSQAAAPLLQQAQSQEIPVIAFDSGVDSDIPVTTVATDNKAAAAAAAEHMAKLLGGKGTVGMIVHDQTSKSGTDRRDGFIEWMEKNAPGIKLLDVRYGGGDPLESANIVKAVIRSNPDLDGFFASNEGSAIGMIQAKKESGAKDLVLVGFDSGKTQIEAIKNGVMAGAITQNPIGMGEQLVKSAMKAINGKTESMPEFIPTGFYWYDKSNIDDPKIQAVLYE
jgi:ribose transport system substrate-binding protein